jgi:hypothetical protein
MNNHPQGAVTHKYRHSVAALLTFVLSILAGPAAQAEPYEYSSQYEEGTQSANEIADTTWPPHQLEALIGQEAGLGADAKGMYQAQQDRYLQFLEQKAAAASGGEPAVEIAADDSGQPWLVGIGVAALAAVASIALAVVRSRRREAVTPVAHDRDTLKV